ncbi:MAG TPA: hypothetical protein VHT27_14010 [Solirubrobacteraceae bacterium]|nr:hypothetical protein [Solirubrobacteraceae bacterium]
MQTRASRSLSRLGRLVWLAVLAGPAAWALQFLFAMQFSLARCESPDARFQFPVHAIAAALGGAGFIVGVAAELLALAVFRATRADPGTQEPDDIATGRIHFLSAVALTVNPFPAVICAMVAIGHPLLTLCRQS